MRDNGALVGSKASTSKAWGKVVGAVQQTKALKQIEYVKALKPSNAFPSSSSSGSSHQTKTTQPAPREPSSRSLFDDNLVFKYMNWLKLIPPGPGLYNLGNTCFLNSTLQCLLHTPALVQILQHEASKALVGIASADQNQNQNLVSISQHFQRLVFEASSTRGGGAISPRAMVYNVRRVGKQFKQGRQEDAHEYLRQLLDTMHEEVLKANRIKLSDGKVSETTFIGRVFGGDLCNELRCKQCNFSSKTYNHFQDLSLDVGQGISSVEGAIKAFVAPEVLSAGNEWHCDGCKRKVQATKRMSVSKSPNVLVLHLKRFSFGQGKIGKPIEFSEVLHLPCEDGKSKSKGPPLSQKTNQPPQWQGQHPKSSTYDLAGIVVHHGGSVHSGHYVAFVRGASGLWFQMDDNRVSNVNKHVLFKQQAYILFYIKRTHDPAPAAAAAAAAAATKAPALWPPTVSSFASLGSAADEDTGSEVDVGLRVAVKGKENSNCEKGKDLKMSNAGNGSGSSDSSSGISRPKYRQGFRGLAPSWTTSRPPPFPFGEYSKLRNFKQLSKQVKSLRELIIRTKGSASDDAKKEGKMNSFNFRNSNHDSENSDEGVGRSVPGGTPTTTAATTAATAATKANSAPVKQLLSQLSKRGREMDEGVWDSTPADALAAKAKLQAMQGQREQHLLASRQPGEMNRLLDAGRVKKVKGPKESMGPSDSSNRFQQILDERGGDRQFFPHRTNREGGDSSKKRRSF